MDPLWKTQLMSVHHPEDDEQLYCNYYCDYFNWCDHWLLLCVKISDVPPKGDNPIEITKVFDWCSDGWNKIIQLFASHVVNDQHRDLLLK